MTGPSPYVTVTVTSTRKSLQAVLAHGEGLVPETYTDLGIGWANVMQAIRNALGGETTSARVSGGYPDSIPVDLSNVEIVLLRGLLLDVPDDNRADHLLAKLLAARAAAIEKDRA